MHLRREGRRAYSSRQELEECVYRLTSMDSSSPQDEFVSHLVYLTKIFQLRKFDKAALYRSYVNSERLCIVCPVREVDVISSWCT
jgi:hypothetical protein